MFWRDKSVDVSIWDINKKYSPAVIFIEVLEGLKQMLVPFKLVSMHCGSDELNIVDGSIPINISLE